MRDASRANSGHGPTRGATALFSDTNMPARAAGAAMPASVIATPAVERWRNCRRVSERRMLPEQLTREVDKVVAPVLPRMPALAFLEHGREAVLFEQRDGVHRVRHRAVVLARTEPQQLQSLAPRVVVERRLVLRFPRGERVRLP